MKRFFALLTAMLLMAATGSAQTFSFEDVFTQDIVITDNSYTSPNIAIEIHVGREYDADYYAAEVYIRDLSSLRHGFGNGKWQGGQQRMSALAEDLGAVLAITGDNAHNFSVGHVFANGEMLRGTTNNLRDVGVIFSDGVMDVLPGKGLSIEDLKLAGDPWLTFLFGPGLMTNEGGPIRETNSKVRGKNPRTAFGYIEPGHYMLVVVDGRTAKNRGMTMLELALLMYDLGCSEAYNLDGGQSAMMWFNGKIVNDPYKGGRRIADAYYVSEPR